ncbi:MAG: nuclear transport factor 2 family protein [Chloroflexota bacterium]
MTASDVAVVHAWHQAVNAGDLDRVVALSSDDIEVGGQRGANRGIQVLREWVGRAGIRLEPRRVFHRDQTVVVEQGAAWRAPETGEVAGQLTPASVFVVRDGRVTSVIRHPDLASALAAAGLGEADAV